MSILRDYFRYFPDNPELEHWGVWVAASGIATIPAGNAYPPLHHPGDHHFEWELGRVLESLQILLITSGSGWFETRSSGKQKVGPGDRLPCIARSLAPLPSRSTHGMAGKLDRAARQGHRGSVPFGSAFPRLGAA